MPFDDLVAELRLESDAKRTNWLDHGTMRPGSCRRVSAGEGNGPRDQVACRSTV
jgi:hypothetical protein